MKRIIMQAYVKGSVEAVALYQKAFDAKLTSEYKHEDGSYYHSELDIYGQCLAVSEDKTSDKDGNPGTTMQFCIHFDVVNKDKVIKAYEILKEDADIRFPLGPCEYAALMVDLVDKFGVRWCILAD